MIGVPRPREESRSRAPPGNALHARLYLAAREKDPLAKNEQRHTKTLGNLSEKVRDQINERASMKRITCFVAVCGLLAGCARLTPAPSQPDKPVTKTELVVAQPPKKETPASDPA